MNVQENSVYQEDFIMNILAQTVAINYLAQATNLSLEYWSQKIGEEANERFERLTQEQKNGIIQGYLKVKTMQFEDDDD